MSPELREVAAHVPLPGLVAVRLFGGPWDGREVWVRDPQARLVLIHGPRHGDHRVWITHTYERRNQRLEFVSTEVTPLSAALAGPRRDTLERRASGDEAHSPPTE